MFLKIVDDTKIMKSPQFIEIWGIFVFVIHVIDDVEIMKSSPDLWKVERRQFLLYVKGMEPEHHAFGTPSFVVTICKRILCDLRRKGLPRVGHSSKRDQTARCHTGGLR